MVVNNNGIRLEPDVNKPEPVSVVSLACDLVSIDDEVTKVPENNARIRPIVTAMSNNKSNAVLKEISLDGLIKAS